MSAEQGSCAGALRSKSGTGLADTPARAVALLELWFRHIQMHSVPIPRYMLSQATERARNQKLRQNNRQKIEALQHLLQKSEVGRYMK